MGSWQYAMLWACFALVRGQSPGLPSTRYISFNPTQTTICLEKPHCSSSTAATIYLYVVQNGVTNVAVYDNTNKVLLTSYTSSNGGSLKPYVADNFANPGCVIPDLSKLGEAAVVSEILDNYIIRVGKNVNCLTDPNFTGICNPPLKNDTFYRFKYVFADGTGIKQSETDWSPAITTIKAKQSSDIRPGPGGRSGGMIVLTSILSVLLFFLLLGFGGMIASCFIVESSAGADITTHDTRTSHRAPTKSHTSSDTLYSATVPEV